MNATSHVLPVAGPPIAGQPRISAIEGWTVREYPVVSSTNLMAANLSAWEAVRAATQTAGRGRFQRRWVSDEGGLWLSAVVPVEPTAARALPLAAGLAVCDALRAAGVNRIRLRWPNDVLVHDLKLAGLLVDQFAPGLAVIGIGVNVYNRPEAGDIRLKNQTTRLADLLPATPTLCELATLLLGHLRSVVQELQEGGFNALLPRVNRLWNRDGLVELDLDGPIRRGRFAGIDGEGRLILADEAGGLEGYASHQVRQLKEI